MRLARAARIKGEGAVGLLVIVLLILGGIVWWLYSSRHDAERNALAFATEVANRVAVNYDEKYLHVHLSPDGQKTYLRSSRDLLLDRLRGFGAPVQVTNVQGELMFTSYFFDPHGTFHAQLKYPAASGQLDMDVSRGMTVWQLDSIVLTGSPPPTPPPIPVPTSVAAPTPAPTPASEPKRKR